MNLQQVVAAGDAITTDNTDSSDDHMLIACTLAGDDGDRDAKWRYDGNGDCDGDSGEGDTVCIEGGVLSPFRALLCMPFCRPAVPSSALHVSSARAKGVTRELPRPGLPPPSGSRGHLLPAKRALGPQTPVWLRIRRPVSSIRLSLLRPSPLSHPACAYTRHT